MKLQDCKIVYICPDHNERYHKRYLHTQTLLESIGCKNVTHYKSGTEDYPRCLLKAQMTILIANMDEPVLMLEDDIDFTGVDTFDFVPDADAIYFGLSKSGGHPTKNLDFGSAIIEPYSDNQVLVKNMLATHAILYISKEYKQAIINLFLEYFNITHHTDVLISRIQTNYKILANKRPQFFQSVRYNDGMHIQNWTNVVINNKLEMIPGPTPVIFDP